MRIHLLVSNDIRYDQRMIRVASSLQDAGYQILLIGRKKRIHLYFPPMSLKPCY